MTIATSIDPGLAPFASTAADSAATAAGIEASIARATAALLKAQRPDGHWVFELEADATIPAEYVLLVHWLGEAADPELERKIGVYLRRIQGDSAHNPGGWALFHDGAIDLSATVKAYFALKMIGDDLDAPHMARARAAILARGGAAATNVFTRIQLALFGALSWNAIPTMPPEIILLPRWFPVHISRMSYWARTVIVPLLVLQTKQPVAANPRGVRVPELFGPPVKVGAASHQKRLWAAFFGAVDVLLKAGNGLWPKRLRARALQACFEFVGERLNGEDGLGAIYPAMANSVMMYAALGYPADHPQRAIARRSVEKLLVVKNDEAYCQPCVSPVWDTALAAHALMEVGTPAAETAALAGLDWLLPLQELEVKGDWAERKPDVRPGGWAFQYRNAHYPDLDDTAVVVMALDRAQRGTSAAPSGARGTSAAPSGARGTSAAVSAAHGTGDSEAIERGIEWTVGLQSANGGWGAFDADNTDHYLNNIPFADHGALLDPPTVDVSARCISMLAQRGEPADSARMQAAIAYVLKDQLADGSWFGRWGVNYIYGTWSALCALNAAGFEPQAEPMRRAVAWLVSIQNDDGGWGEDCDSYRLDYDGHRPAPSIASQTGWALLGLMAAGEADNPAVARGIAWLQATLGEDGEWPEEHYTGGGFPRVFYLRYHGYRRYFPLWAMARYRNLKASNSGKVPFGM